MRIFLDAIGQEIHELGVFLDTMEHDWDCDEELSGSVMYVEEVSAVEKFRGLGLRLFTVDTADRILNENDSLLILRPFPAPVLPLHRGG